MKRTFDDRLDVLGETGKWEVMRGFTVAAGGVSKAGECPAAGSAEIVHHTSFGGLESEHCR